MARAPRFIPQGATIEVTCRTLHGRLLLRPCKHLNRWIEAILARALELYPLELHAYNFMSNHWHMVLTVESAQRVSEFIQHVNGNIARIVKQMYGVEGPVWCGRPRIRYLLDDAAILRRIRYVLANGVKEGLVPHPTQWPGASAARALCDQIDVQAFWSDAEMRRAARRRGESDESTGRWVAIRLAPPPSLRNMSREQRGACFKAMLDEIAIQGHVARKGRPPAGVAFVLACDPRSRQPLEPSAVPRVSASDDELVRRFRDLHAEFVAAYRAAATRLRLGELDAPFPPGAIPPRRPSIPWPAAVARAA